MARLPTLKNPPRLATGLKIAILGRPNVGKSTLFNRLFGKRRAIVHDIPGVTRDRLIEKAVWERGPQSFPVSLVDTGGVVLQAGPAFSTEIKRQVEIAVAQSDLVLFVVDGAIDLVPEDREFARYLRQLFGQSAFDEKVWLILNKLDRNDAEFAIAEFSPLGFSKMLQVSAEHGRGVETLKDEIMDAFSEHSVATLSDEAEDAAPSLPAIPTVALVGKPNVGKSTLLNKIVGEERMIVSAIAGTTVDSIDTTLDWAGRELTLVDTAGIRRKSKTEQGVEVLSILQTKKAIERASLVLFLIDGMEGVTEQDEKIAGLIEEVGKPVIILISKWDLQRHNRTITRDSALEEVEREIPFLKYAPVLFISAATGYGLEQVPEMITKVLENQTQRVSTHELTEWVRNEAGIHNPGNVKFYLSQQVSNHPVTFVFHVSQPEKVQQNLRRHIGNTIRKRYGFAGCPMHLVFKPRGGKKALTK